REDAGVLVGSSGDIAALREVWEDGRSAAWVGEALDDLLAFSRRRVARPVDGRIAAAIDAIGRADEGLSAARIAARVGLSASRFQHLFTQEVGVPFRRYRAWRRVRVAIAEVVRGSRFTAAAHAAGYADQAHFTNDFRRTFGGPPSLSLLGLRT